MDPQFWDLWRLVLFLLATWIAGSSAMITLPASVYVELPGCCQKCSSIFGELRTNLLT